MIKCHPRRQRCRIRRETRPKNRSRNEGGRNRQTYKQSNGRGRFVGGPAALRPRLTWRHSADRWAKEPGLTFRLRKWGLGLGWTHLTIYVALRQVFFSVFFLQQCILTAQTAKRATPLWTATTSLRPTLCRLSPPQWSRVTPHHGTLLCSQHDSQLQIYNQ